MEHIGEVLASKSRQTLTALPISNIDREPTEAEILEQDRKMLGLTNWQHTFDKFNVLPGTQKTFNSVKALAEGKHQPMLLICGGLGNGKTYLCEAVSISLYKKGVKCKVWLWSDLRRWLLQLMHRPQPNLPTYDTYFDRLRNSPRLIIDDFGMGSKGSEWEIGEIEDIINYRYRERLFTLMTTNRTLEELPARIVSRFFDPEVSEIIINEGKDYRIKK